MKKDDLKDIADADRIEAFVWTYIIEPDALKVAHKLKLRLRKKEPAEGYYVYLLIDSRDKKIFYVGKGKGKRMHAHVVETTHGRIANSVKSDKINEILAAGAEVLERVIFTTKRESVAFTVERFLIDRLKEHGLTEPVRRKPLILMEGKAHKVFGRAVTLPYAHLHLFLHRRTSASCERSAESFSRKGV